MNGCGIRELFCVFSIVDVPSVADFSNKQYAIVSFPVDNHSIVADAEAVQLRVAKTLQVVVGLPDNIIQFADDTLGRLAFQVVELVGGAGTILDGRLSHQSRGEL